MESVPVHQMRDTIIVEKSKGNKVFVGSHFYCGCCGKSLGQSKKSLKFPFSVETFKNSLKNKTFDTMLFGLHHKTCGHTMFSFRKQYGFTPFDVWMEDVRENTRCYPPLIL